MLEEKGEKILPDSEGLSEQDSSHSGNKAKKWQMVPNEIKKASYSKGKS